MNKEVQCQPTVSVPNQSNVLKKMKACETIGSTTSIVVNKNVQNRSTLGNIITESAQSTKNNIVKKKELCIPLKVCS